MATIKYRTWMDDEVTEVVNACKDVILIQLMEEGVINNKDAEERIQDWHVQIEQPSWVSRAWGRIIGIADKNKACVIILKQLNLQKPLDKNEKSPSDDLKS